MRVLWLIKSFGIGGTERLLLELCEHMPDVEFVPVALRDRPSTLAPSYTALGMTPRYLRGHNVAASALSLRRVIGELDPDLLHLHNPLPGTIGRLVAHGRLPVVYTEHGPWEGYRRLSRWANAVTFGRSDAITVVSRAVNDSLARHRLGRRSLRRVSVVPNGIDDEKVISEAGHRADPGAGAPVYGSVIHLTRRKGADVFVQAAGLLHHRVDARGVVVGGGPMMPTLEHAIRRSGAAVSLCGPSTDARRIMRGFDVFVLPSRTEGLPMALLEAMALGLPIVATAVGGTPEVLNHERNGLLVAPDDPSAVADATERLLRDRELAARLGLQATKDVRERWHVSRTAAGFRSIYEQVAMRRGA